jgi:hypothetical protein
LDSWFKSLGVLKISAQVQACSQPLWMQQILPKSAQNYPKLQEFAKICPKMKLRNSTRNRDFSVFQKKKILRVEEVLEYVSVVRIFNPRIFHMLFLLSKNGLCIWISAYPFAGNNFFGNLPQLWWIWDFAHMYLTQLGTRMWSPESHIYVQKWFFWPPKHCCTSRAQWEKTFSLTLNLIISQTVRNECLRLGGHVGIQVSYKIL